MFLAVFTVKRETLELNVVTNTGEKLSDLVKEGKILLVFLRHFGCTFCRETMTDLATHRKELEEQNVELILVHMASTELAEEIFSLYELEGVKHISDPDQKLYNDYGLYKASMRAIAGARVLIKAFYSALFRGHIMGKPVGDPNQMPGMFYFRDSEIINKFTYKFISDRPDYLRFIS